MESIRKLKFFAAGEWMESKTDKFMDVFNPSTGEVLAQTPCCTKQEVEFAIAAAKTAFDSWSQTPVFKRVQVLYKFRDLVEKHMDELTDIVAREHGKIWAEAQGDILKVKEPVEFACSAPSLMLGESLMDTSSGYDTVLYKEPVGVFAGIVPFNFPGMIPMGWMAPLCIATGNTMVLKAASMTPMTAMRLTELWQEAGLPAGVINILTCSRNEAEIFLTHPDIKGVSFVGSTSVGLHIYATAAQHGKRVQTLCEAKNHGLVLEDAALERSARGIINSAFGCAGERCMRCRLLSRRTVLRTSWLRCWSNLPRSLKSDRRMIKHPTLAPPLPQRIGSRLLNGLKKALKKAPSYCSTAEMLLSPGMKTAFISARQFLTM